MKAVDRSKISQPSLVTEDEYQNVPELMAKFVPDNLLIGVAKRKNGKSRQQNLLANQIFDIKENYLPQSSTMKSL